MGCDIHIVLETRRRQAGGVPAGPWIGVYCTNYFPDRPKIAQRDYDFFAAVANVRGSGKRYPQFLPEDVSALAWREYMRSPTDHHSASHMTADEFVAVYHEVNPPPEGEERFGAYRLLNADGDEDDHRVVFWFDN